MVGGYACQLEDWCGHVTQSRYFFNCALALPLAKEILANSIILLYLVRSSAIMSDDSFASA